MMGSNFQTPPSFPGGHLFWDTPPLQTVLHPIFINGLGAKPPKLGFRVHLMLLGQIWYHWKAKSLRSMNPADAKLARWAVAMETASEVQ